MRSDRSKVIFNEIHEDSNDKCEILLLATLKSIY